MKVKYNIVYDKIKNVTSDMLQGFIDNNDIDLLYKGEVVGKILNNQEFALSVNFVEDHESKIKNLMFAGV